jgi:plastocyanin
VRRCSLVGLLATCAALVALVLTGCSSSHKAAAPQGRGASSSSTSGDVVINNFAYSGKLTVSPGEKITIVNKDSVAHTLTDKSTHLFDSGNINGGGATATITAPTKPGSYNFGCSYHPQMHGTLVVSG